MSTSIAKTSLTTVALPIVGGMLLDSGYSATGWAFIAGGFLCLSFLLMLYLDLDLRKSVDEKIFFLDENHFSSNKDYNEGKTKSKFNIKRQNHVG